MNCCPSVTTPRKPRCSWRCCVSGGSRKPPIPTVVELTPADGQFVGRVLCDDIGPLYKDELGPPKGALSLATMRRVDLGLRAALGTG